MAAQSRGSVNVLVEPEKLSLVATELVADGAEVVFVGGGDGTVRARARRRDGPGRPPPAEVGRWARSPTWYMPCGTSPTGRCRSRSS